MDSPDRLPKHLLIAFLLALGIYAGFFVFDQSMRTRNGPWQVSFETNAQGFAAIRVDHSKLALSNVLVVFLGERATNSGGRMLFDKPQQPVPFGKVKFEDLTYLPGSVAFDFFGHEMELLPRTMYLNKKEFYWTNNTVIELRAEEKLPPEASYDPRQKKRRPFSK